MRLTLRTLLAYIDDTLPPQQTREIGQKVAEHEAARELIARIRSVTRRRRLTTPEMASSGEANVDPNVVAEYLDNELTPERIEELEKLCLESDVHLAEVAACHQILTVILGEPSKVPPTAYQRMYGLVLGRESIPNRKPPQPEFPLEDSVRDAADEHEEALLLGMPAYQRSSPWVQRLIPVAAAGLLIVCLAGIIFVAATGVRKPVELVSATQPASTSAKEPEQLPVAKTPVDSTPDAATPGPPPTEPPSVAEPVKQWAGWVPMWSSWVAARPEMPVAMFLVYGHDEVISDTVVDHKATPVVRTITPPSLVQVQAAQHILNKEKDAGPALLLRQLAADDFRYVRPESRIKTGEMLLALPGYRSELLLDSKVRLSLVGTLPSVQENLFYEAAAMLHDNPEVALDMTLDRGRTVIANRPEGNAPVRLRFLDQVWDVKLLQPETRIGFELHGRVPRGTGEWLPQIKVALLVHGGDIELTRDGKTEKLDSGKVFLWNHPSVNQAPGLTTELKEVPFWLKETKANYPPEVRTALVNVLERLSKKPAVAEEKTPWILISCEECLQEPATWQRWIGLFSLGALDNLRLVVRSLDETEKHDMRFAALDTLRTWTGRKPDQDAPLRALLEQREYSPEECNLFLQYLRGYDQFNAAIVRQLISSLNNNRLIIRELALQNLNMAVPPDKLSEFKALPLQPTDVRQRAVETLESRLLPKP